MTFQEAIKKEKKWHRKAMLINLFHNSMLLRKKKWTMRESAKKLDISLGAISESIRLAKAILENSELEKMKREDAIRSIR